MKLEGAVCPLSSPAGVGLDLASPACPPPALLVAAPSPAAAAAAAAAAEQLAPPLAEFTDHHAH